MPQIKGVFKNHQEIAGFIFLWHFERLIPNENLWDAPIVWADTVVSLQSKILMYVKFKRCYNVRQRLLCSIKQLCNVGKSNGYVSLIAAALTAINKLQGASNWSPWNLLGHNWYDFDISCLSKNANFATIRFKRIILGCCYELPWRSATDFHALNSERKFFEEWKLFKWQHVTFSVHANIYHIYTYGNQIRREIRWARSIGFPISNVRDANIPKVSTLFTHITSRDGKFRHLSPSTA